MTLEEFIVSFICSFAALTVMLIVGRLFLLGFDLLDRGKTITGGFILMILVSLCLAVLPYSCTPKAKADDIFARYASNSDFSAKALSVGTVVPAYVLNYKTEGGVIFDNRGGRGANPFISVGVGIAPQAGAFFVELYQSVLYSTNPDGTYLSSNFEFSEDFAIGIRGKRDEVISIGWKHISNAGIWEPNLGLDLLNLSVRLPL